jgi:pyruvate formate lyase activating enzyme
MEGTIFNIQCFSIGDGEGIRTTVFFMGCPLSCAWCHNPESQSSVPILGFDKDKCTACQSCACSYNAHTFEGATHQIDRRACKTCGKCAERCPNGALELLGYRTSTDEILNEVCF